MIRIMSIVMVLFLTASSAYSASVLEVAARDVGVVEKTNKNDGTRIEEILKYMGLPKGQPYCASAVVWWYNHSDSTTKLPKIGRVATLRKYFRGHETKFKTIKPDDVLLGITKLKPADMSLWAHGAVVGGDFNGHIALITSQLNNKQFTTIDANTQSGEAGNQREGGGIYRRTRKVALSGTFRTVDFVRVR